MKTPAVWAMMNTDRGRSKVGEAPCERRATPAMRRYMRMDAMSMPALVMLPSQTEPHAARPREQAQIDRLVEHRVVTTRPEWSSSRRCPVKLCRDDEAPQHRPDPLQVAETVGWLIPSRCATSLPCTSSNTRIRKTSNWTKSASASAARIAACTLAWKTLRSYARRPVPLQFHEVLVEADRR